ncbi:MAG: hypothetical protein Q9186_004153 [Xanthomendoza sp. 1 TL-2023]
MYNDRRLSSRSQNVRHSDFAHYTRRDELQVPDDVSGDDEPDDQSTLALWLRGCVVDTKEESSTPVQVPISTGKPPNGKPNPYTETIERILHSRFRDDSSQPDDIVAQLSTAPEQVGSLSAKTALFHWMYVVFIAG